MDVIQKLKWMLWSRVCKYPWVCYSAFMQCSTIPEAFSSKYYMLSTLYEPLFSLSVSLVRDIYDAFILTKAKWMAGLSAQLSHANCTNGVSVCFCAMLVLCRCVAIDRIWQQWEWWERRMCFKSVFMPKRKYSNEHENLNTSQSSFVYAHCSHRSLTLAEWNMQTLKHVFGV